MAFLNEKKPYYHFSVFTLSMKSGHFHSITERQLLVMSNESIVITCNLTNRRQFSVVCTLIDVLKTRVTALTKKIATPSRHFHLLYSYRFQLATNQCARNRSVIVNDCSALLAFFALRAWLSQSIQRATNSSVFLNIQKLIWFTANMNSIFYFDKFQSVKISLFFFFIRQKQGQSETQQAHGSFAFNLNLDNFLMYMYRRHYFHSMDYVCMNNKH